MNANIAVIPRDGIGPEVVEQAILVLDRVGEKFGHKFSYKNVLAGGCAVRHPPPPGDAGRVQGVGRGFAGRDRRLEVGHPARGSAAGARAVGASQGA